MISITSSKMKKVLCLMFFVFALVFTDKNAQKRGNKSSKGKGPEVTPNSTINALRELTRPDRPITLEPVSLNCRSMDMKPICNFSAPEIGIPCDFKDSTCYAKTPT